MTEAVTINSEAVLSAAAGWPQTIPPSAPHPPPPTGAGEVSAAAAASIAAWLGVHAAMCAHRQARADKYTADLNATTGQLVTADTDNGTNISAIQEV